MPSAKYWQRIAWACALGLAILALFNVTVIALAALPAPAPNKKPPLKPVNINLATVDELQQVPGIGSATAAKIIQMRKSYGAFKSVDDLRAIRGIGPKRLEKMRPYLTVGKTSPPKNSGSSPAAQPANPQKP
jgi:comEA protein